MKKSLEYAPAVAPSESDGITTSPCKTSVPFLIHNAFLRLGLPAGLTGRVILPSEVFAPNNLKLL